MAKKIKFQDGSRTEASCWINQYADECPVCRKSVEPLVNSGWMPEHERILFVAFRCPNNKCQHLYTGVYYQSEQHINYERLYLLQKAALFRSITDTKFSKVISELSLNFVQIFLEAEAADQNNFKLIAGPGYRKALEFLIKDFLITYKFKDDKEKIEFIKSNQLGKCWSFIDNSKIVDCGERAAWLGNDETHYVRKWKDKDLEDLKKLISITKHWIEMELESAEYSNSMMEKSKELKKTG